MEKPIRNRFEIHLGMRDGASVTLTSNKGRSISPLEMRRELEKFIDHFLRPELHPPAPSTPEA